MKFIIVIREVDHEAVEDFLPQIFWVVCEGGMRFTFFLRGKDIGLFHSVRWESFCHRRGGEGKRASFYMSRIAMEYEER